MGEVEMQDRYEILLQIEQVLSKLERTVPAGLRKEIGISKALDNVGKLIDGETEKKHEELEKEYAMMQQAIEEME
tara:strand:+ start:1081 stop:1305 length:225 start_codon:yes stop_codon:yes gene_type:complete